MFFISDSRSPAVSEHTSFEIKSVNDVALMGQWKAKGGREAGARENMGGRSTGDGRRKTEEERQERAGSEKEIKKRKAFIFLLLMIQSKT